MKAPIKDCVVYSPYPSIEIPVCSFYALAKEKLLWNPNKTALVDDVTSITRVEVLSRMQRYAVGFQRNGVVPGDRICVHLKNSVENILAMYGCILAGAAVVLAKTSLNISDLRYQAEDSDSTHILTDMENTEKVTRSVASLSIKGLFCMGRTAGFVSATEFAELDESEYQECPVDDPKSTVLAVCYTSGSTGRPKGVEMTHYNYVASFYTTRFVLPFRDGDVFLGLNPITHQSGMLYTVIVMLDGGTSIITSASLNSVEIMDAVDKYKVTGVHLFPSRLQALLREMHRTGRQLPSVKHLVITGSVLSTSVADRARKAFERLESMLNMYAMTESCCIITAQPKTGGARTGDDTGVPNTTVMLKVVDLFTGQKLGPHRIGEICYHISGMALGYYKRPKETAELFDEEGWCKSGDAGYYDDDGHLYIVERLKQLIKCMDNQVAPGELEELLLREHSVNIAEVTVVGLPHSEYGEAAAAAVVLSQEGSEKNPELLAKGIKATVETHFAVYKHLHGGVFFVDSLPKTDNAKVNRPALARFLAAGTGKSAQV